MYTLLHSDNCVRDYAAVFGARWHDVIMIHASRRSWASPLTADMLRRRDYISVRQTQKEVDALGSSDAEASGIEAGFGIGTADQYCGRRYGCCCHCSVVICRNNMT